MSSDEIVQLLPNRWKTFLLTILVPVVGWLGIYVWNTVKPETSLAPITRQLQRVDSSISALEGRVTYIEKSSLILDYRFNAIERFLCLDNRKRATLAGIRCDVLLPK